MQILYFKLTISVGHIHHFANQIHIIANRIQRFANQIEVIYFIISTAILSNDEHRWWSVLEN